MINNAKEKLDRRESVTGIWSIIPSPTVSEILASAKLDFIILDMEHGPFDMSIMAECIRASAGTNCSPLVRIPYVEPSIIQRVLDMGAHGIVAPQIRTKADAEHLVSCCRFSPSGIRGYNPYTRAGDFLSNHSSPYLAERFPLITVIIENSEAYQNLDDLLGVEGIDAYYLGIYDMSCAFGTRGDLTSSKMNAFVADASARISTAGKVIGKMVDRRPVPGDADDATYFYVLQPDTYQLKKSILDRL